MDVTDDWLRRKLLRDIRRNLMPLSLALTATPTGWMDPMTLEEMCSAKRHIGPQRVAEALEGTGLRPDLTLGEMTDTDRELAVLALRDRWPNLMD